MYLFGVYIYIYIYIYIYYCIVFISPVPLCRLTCFYVRLRLRPISLLRLWISEALNVLTQAESQSSGVEFPGPWGSSRRI